MPDYDHFADDLPDAQTYVGQTAIYVDDPHGSKLVFRVAFIVDAAYVDAAESRYLTLHPGTSHEAYVEQRDAASRQFGAPGATNESPKLHATLMVLIPNTQMMTRIGVPYVAHVAGQKPVKFTWHLKADAPK